MVRRLRFGGCESREVDRLVLGDNLQYLKNTRDEVVDVIYVDPPFGTGQVRRGQSASYRDMRENPQVFVEWLWPRLVHSKRVLKRHGSMFVHLDYRTVHYVKIAMDKLFGRELFVNEIIWCYSVGGKSARRFGRKHDTILWYANSSDYAFYSDAIRIARKPKSHMRLVQLDDGQWVQEKTDRRTGKVYRYPMQQGKIPEDWWADVETLNRSDRERCGWPTQKPLRLIERLVKATSQPADVIGDWFCGSGTTAVAAQKLGRRFVTIDSEERAVHCAIDRLVQQAQVLVEAGTPPRDILVEAYTCPHEAADEEHPPDQISR